MFKEVYDKILVVGRVLVDRVPMGYEMPSKDHVGVVASMVEDTISYHGAGTGLSTVPFFAYEDDETFIMLSDVITVDDNSDNKEPNYFVPGTLLVNQHIVLDGKVKHVVCITADNSSKSTADISLIITTLALTIATDSIRRNIGLLANTTSIDSSMSVINLYSVLVIVTALLDTLIPTYADNAICKYAKIAYSDKIQTNITTVTIRTIRTLLSERSLEDLLDNSAILVVYNNYQSIEFQQAYPDFKIDDISEDEDLTEFEQMTRDCIPVLVKFGDSERIYHAMATEEDLNDYVDDPEHYLILYVRTNDDGSGDWATLETKRVSVNKGGTIVFPADVDISSVITTDDDGRVEYINIDDVHINDIIVDAISEISDDGMYPTFEKLMEWVSEESTDSDKEKFIG